MAVGCELCAGLLVGGMGEVVGEWCEVVMRCVDGFIRTDRCLKYGVKVMNECMGWLGLESLDRKGKRM